LKDARDRLAEVSGDRKYADDFFDRYIEGREIPDYQKLFARVGLVLRKTNPGGPWVGVLDQGFAAGGRGRRGRQPATPGATATGVPVQALVNWGTPAFQAGIEEGDVLTSADGRPIATVDDWQAAVRAYKPGDSMAVEFTRHGKALKTTVAVAEDPTVEVVAIESTGVALSADQKMMRDAWLSTKRR